VNVSALGLVHKLAELDDVVVDRADEESDALIDPAGCSLVERFDNLGLDRPVPTRRSSRTRRVECGGDPRLDIGAPVNNPAA
jgi:hypothetical protein